MGSRPLVGSLLADGSTGLGASGIIEFQELWCLGAMVPFVAQGACGGLGDGIEVLLSAFDCVGIDVAVLLPVGIDRSDLQSDVRRL